MKRLHSLHARLLIPLLGLMACIWLGAVVMTWIDAQHELDELLDGHLAQAAALLVVQQSSPDDDDEVADAPSLHKYAPKVAFQMFHEGQLVMRSANASLKPMSKKVSGFETTRLEDGNQWRVFATRGAKHDIQVYVGEQVSSRQAILWVVLRGMLWPLAFALPLMAIAGWWVVRLGLAPVRQLKTALTQRKPQALESITLTDLPAELRPLVMALNELFERISRMIATERRFTADAAHELRTPIAAIRAQAQVALGAGDDRAQQSHALHATLAGCDRATRLVEQLLTLARVDAGATPLLGTIDLGATTRHVAADLAGSALTKQQTMTLNADDGCSIAGNETLIAVMVRNLLDNAIRYTPKGGGIQIDLKTISNQVMLHVQDSGPGMSDADAIRLGERFFRVLGHEQPGSGLGWSIVRRIAEVSDAQVSVKRSALLGGLFVAVVWLKAHPVE